LQIVQEDEDGEDAKVDDTNVSNVEATVDPKAEGTDDKTPVAGDSDEDDAFAR
jgi:hypothetical protein